MCDWMLFGIGHCVVIDATNHAVKEDAAQGLATWDEYSADIEKIFTEGKFGQLLPTIDLVKKHGGWGNENVDADTMFVPLVIVPDAGVVNGLLTQFDINVRGHKKFKHLQRDRQGCLVVHSLTWNGRGMWPPSSQIWPTKPILWPGCKTRFLVR